ncbi:site-specific DNA recombinase [Tissierella praeacuta DSM 18095]|uniref:Site-specific DNA recombinase n=1 Tax=Tissierella praeacuta DSM 18095 TaxID=1123404 RepID=A0A1M4X9L0_9FIRM|nr:recombinase family protein [Tissierella praeacuta]SHE90081.1 site-specific DNA recombinase [Tissierella praeacuta DSM 18095]SUP02541.1 multiple promoter invertase [Tissierella praeacuta]
MKKIMIIPAKNSLESKGKLNVAAYCRVSTERESQQGSIDLQIRQYTKLIQNNPEWDFAGVFYDYESGLRKDERNGLDAMLKKAYKGEIDYIITKSISRLSRNVLDILTIIRGLKARGINIYFEKEDLNSLEEEKEIDIAFNGALAQEESRNLSENIRWGYQRKFERGDNFAGKSPMGYRCKNDKLIIVPEESDIIRKIYQLYLEGSTLQQIKEYLEQKQIKTATGKEIWATAVIQKILKNEKYKGDTMLQKTYTEDFMTGRKSKNDGQKNRYYVTDSHPAIISDEVYDRVQEEMNRRARLVYKEDGTVESSIRKYNGKYLLGNLLICGYCGASYRRRTERDKVVWRCATRIEKGKERCADSPTLNEEWVKEILGDTVCGNGSYDEEIVRNRGEKILIFNEYLEICSKNKDKVRIPFTEFCFR